MNIWWDDDPAQRYWMEITDRHDIGAALLAPKIPERTTPGYDLVSFIQPGDRVLHWSITASRRAFIGWSDVAAHVQTIPEYTWTPKNGEERTTEGWVGPLSGYTAFTEPLPLDLVRDRMDAILALRVTLEDQHQGTVYFPFYLYGGRELRTQQSYFVKFPIELFDLLPELTAVQRRTPLYAPEPDEVTEDRVTGSGRRSREAANGRVPRVQDPILRKALEEHAVAEAIAHYGRVHDVTEFEILGKPYDIALTMGGKERHVEVKGSSLLLDTVELTINEVTHAADNQPTDLVVVDRIDWVRKADGSVSTSGGRLRVWYDWKPASTALAPRKYAYTLPPGGEQPRQQVT